MYLQHSKSWCQSVCCDVQQGREQMFQMFPQLRTRNPVLPSHLYLRGRGLTFINNAKMNVCI